MDPRHTLPARTALEGIDRELAGEGLERPENALVGLERSFALAVVSLVLEEVPDRIVYVLWVVSVAIVTLDENVAVVASAVSNPVVSLELADGVVESGFDVVADRVQQLVPRIRVSRQQLEDPSRGRYPQGLTLRSRLLARGVEPFRPA